MKALKMMPVMAIMVLMSFTSCSTDNISEEIESIELQAAPEASLMEIEVLELINNYRINQGLDALNNLNIIKSVAVTHTDYMVEENNVSHDFFYQRKNSLIENASATHVSENVAYAYNSAQAVVNAWINSDGHRANIEGDFTDFDISAEQNQDGKWYFTNIFIKR